jgi:hypothetical protein
MSSLSPKTATLVGVATTAVLSLFDIPVMAFTLNNGSGDGTVTVGVDGFGSFGSAVGGEGTSNAVYDPVGEIGPAGTAFESAVALGFGGTRSFLSSGFGNSGGTNPIITGSSTSANSSFSSGGLSFQLTQTLIPLFNGTNRTGSALTQVYNITNTSGAALDFDLVRYFDGDLDFDGSLIDGGGRLVANGTEILFETDSATGSADETTFIGITGEGGTIPTTNRFELDEFPDLRSRIIQGVALDGIITGDNNSDQFVDAGAGYDITPTLRNTFSLGAAQSTTYTTRTIFGSGAPGEVVIPPPPPPTEIPFEFSPGLGILMLGAWGAIAQLKNKVQKRKSSGNALSKN